MFHRNQFNCESDKVSNCGLFTILPPNDSGVQTEAPIPLQSVSVFASVVHAVAQVELTQIFINKESNPIEAIYYFPVDSNAGVTHFHAELEGRTIKGVVKAEEEAKEQYDKAVKAQTTAFLVESSKPDIFKLKVGFLKPGSQVKVVLGYVTEVKNEPGSNAMRFFIPTTVAPRYIPPTETDKKALDLANMKFSSQSPAPLTIKVNVSIQGKIASIESPSHKIKESERGAVANRPSWSKSVIEIEGTTTDMDKDFVILITPAEVHTPRIYLEKFENSTALMSHLIPSFKLDEQKCELIFILDRSGSMDGQSIELAKKALLLFLHSAPADCYLNIVGFGSSFQFLFPESVKYDDGSLKKAIAHSESLRADLGGTEIFQPLKAVFEKPTIPNYLRQIFVLTDGEVSNTEQVIGLVKAYSHSSRIFSLGIGDASSHYLVEGIATAGGGTAAFVGYQEKIETKVLQQLKNAIQPSLTDAKIEWIGLPENSSMDLSGSNPPAPVVNKEKTLLGYGKPVETVNQKEKKEMIYQVPENIPPVYDGSQFLVFGLFPNEFPTGAKIAAISPDGPLSLDISCGEDNDVGPSGMLHKLAAIKLVKDLELQSTSLSFLPRVGKTEESLKKEIIELSCKHEILSKYTSFIAVDSASNEPSSECWAMQTRSVPSQIATGWHGGSGINARYQSIQFGAPVVGMCAPQPMMMRRKMKATPFSFSSNLSFDQNSSQNYRLASDSGSLDLDGEEESDSISMSKKMGSSRDASIYERAEPQMDTEKISLKKVDLSESDILHEIVGSQSFNGSFSLSEKLMRAVGTTLEAVNEAIKTGSWDEVAFATAIAIAYFTHKLGDLKDSWELVHLKAMKWMEKTHPQNCKAILEAAAKFIQTI